MKEVYVGVQFENIKMQDDEGKRITELNVFAVKVANNSDYTDHQKALTSSYENLVLRGPWNYTMYSNDYMQVIMYEPTLIMKKDNIAALHEADKQRYNVKITNPMRWRPHEIYLHKLITVGISIAIGVRVLHAWHIL